MGEGGGEGEGGGGRVHGPSRIQGKKKKIPDKASMSRSNDTENYLPWWEGWFVEANEAVETAFDITAGSDDDASVKEQDKNTDTTLFPVVWVLYFLFPHCFSLAQFVSDCTRFAIGK